MELRTKGTVQIELKAGANPKFEVLIAPAQSHTATVGNQDFIVFIETPVPSLSSPVKAVAWARDTKFAADVAIHPTLIAVAAGSLCVELQVENKKEPKIVGVVFPASGK